MSRKANRTMRVTVVMDIDVSDDCHDRHFTNPGRVLWYAGVSCFRNHRGRIISASAEEVQSSVRESIKCEIPED